jgi:hypothetical protein
MACLVQHLSFLSTALGELEVDTFACQSLVNLRVCVESVVNTTTLLLVQDNLKNLGAVFLGSDALADNLDRVDEIVQDAVVNGGERAGDWSLLLLGCAAAVGALWAGEDTAGGDDEDVTVGELLLKLAGEAVKILELCARAKASRKRRQELTAAETCAIQEAMGRERR